MPRGMESMQVLLATLIFEAVEVKERLRILGGKTKRLNVVKEFVGKPVAGTFKEHPLDIFKKASDFFVSACQLANIRKDRKDVNIHS